MAADAVDTGYGAGTAEGTEWFDDLGQTWIVNQPVFSAWAG